MQVCTTSLWGALDVPEHLNTEYAPDAAILSPNLAASALRPWYAFYCRGADVI